MKRVVVIGGGFAGSYAARRLQHAFTVTLVDTKEYFEFTPGILRTIVEPHHIKKVQLAHSAYLRSADVVIGHARAITERTVMVGARQIPFDYLILASGSTYALPIKEEDVVRATRAEHLRTYSEKLSRAKDVVIVGGGLVGVELAAEVATHYRGKRITIIHSGSRLIERNPERASRYAERFLVRYGVSLLFHERAVSFNEVVVTHRGLRIKADLVFLCTGIVPHTDFLRQRFSQVLNDRGYVKVNGHLQVQGFSHIFAAGDVNDCAVEKTAQNSLVQADTVVKNILAMERGSSLREWRPKQTSLVISLGKWHGIFVYKRCVWYGRLPGILKSIIESYVLWSMRWLS